jgi:hypothetical protein
MRWHPFALGLVIGWLALPCPAWGILLETPDGPVRGYLLSDDGAKLRVRVVLADGTEKTADYDRSKVTIVHQIDTGRLQKLGKDDPKGYYAYAEELADKKFAADPEARYMARRLFLIAAYLDGRRFGHDALLRLSALAGTEEEKRRCAALAFLLAPEGEAEAPRPAPPPRAPAGDLQDFQKALQSYRTGQIAYARKLANQKGVETVFSLAPGKLDKATFLQWCTNAEGSANTPPPDDALRTVLRAELWAIDQLSHGDAGDTKKAGETKWSAILQARQVRPVPPLSLETIIPEVDPRKYLYRNGKWEAP